MKHPAYLLYTLAQLSGLLLAHSSLASHLIQPDFSAPYSGERVKEYTVTLPLSRDQQEAFTIPRDCQKVNSRLLEGAGRWGSRVQRRLWLKVDDDCRYLNFLKSNPNHADKDFVSSYDFFNAKVSDLPLYPGCDLFLLLHDPSACPPPMHGMPNFSMFMESHAMPGHMEPEADDCRFEGGVFRGHIYHTGAGLRCIEDHHAPGYRILSVDYADVNADGYLDAVLRMAPVGRGGRPSLLILPLTRFSEKEKFVIPQGADYPRLGPA